MDRDDPPGPGFGALGPQRAGRTGRAEGGPTATGSDVHDGDTLSGRAGHSPGAQVDHESIARPAYGAFAGPPEDALDSAAGLYFSDPKL